VALATGLLVTGASPAAAHASLVSVDPPDGARLDESPAAVTLTFSEPVSAELGGVRVLDTSGAPVQQGAARVDGVTVVVDLAADLPDGTYVVTYRVISADGHPVRGGSVFGVGAGTVDTGALGRVASTSGDRPWEVAGAIGRWLAYGGVLAAAGGALFLAYVLRDGHERSPTVRFVRWAALVGALGSLVALPVQAALGTGQGAGSLFDEGVLADVAADGVGLALGLALAGLAVLAACVNRSRRLGVVGALVAATSFAATGHTRAGSTAAMSTLADGAHLVAAAVWGGGLLLLWWTLRARGRQDDADPVATATLVARFSDLATVSIVAVGVAGAALAWSQVRALDALTDTRYGLFLIAKLAAVLGLSVMGAYNHFRLVPAMRRGATTSALVLLRQTLRLEVAGLVAVLALTSVLVVTTPARDSLGGGVVERVVQLGDAGSVQVVVSPAATGRNDLHLYTYDPSGRTADIAESITVELALPVAQLGPIDRAATRAGPAHFQLVTDDFAVGGTWQVTIRARVDRFDEATGTVTIPIAR
jgi:copper transport protein